MEQASVGQHHGFRTWRRGRAISAPAAAIVTGGALTASFPPVDLAPLAWIALWPLLAACRDRRWGARLALGALAGVVWSNTMVGYWLYPAARAHLAAGPVSAAALAGAATWVYGGAYLAAFALIQPWLPRPGWLAGPAAWVVLEAVRTRALAGAPWGLLGQTQHTILPLAQLAELTGVGGLSVLVLLPATALVERGRARRAGLMLAVAGVAGATVFGAVRLRQFGPDAAATGPRVVAQSGLGLAPDAVRAYAAAAMDAPAAALTVWPEATLTSYVDEDPGAAAILAGVARARGWLLVGAPRHTAGADRRYFNSALLFGPDGRLRATYDKRRLVPFAERAPVPGIVRLARPFSPGSGAALPLVAGGVRVGPLICWEAIFPDLARAYAAAGADLLVNLTSDRDLGPGAAQQLALSRFRAIETRRWLVRASGTGGTVMVDPAGRVSARTAIALPEPAPPTFYVRHGDVVTPAAIALLAALLLVEAAANRTSRSGTNGWSRSTRAV